MSRVIGIAGTYCSGKSTASGILRDNGFIEIDVDGLGHAARDAMSGQIQQAFGTVDRGELAKIVFGNPGELARLEAMVHPWMVGEVKKRISDARLKDLDCVINAALLFPMGLSGLCDRVFWITAPFLRRYLRARKRDKAGIIHFLKRVAAQKKLYPQQDQEDVDIITIVNTGNRKRLASRLSECLRNS